MSLFRLGMPILMSTQRSPHLLKISENLKSDDAILDFNYCILYLGVLLINVILFNR